eukprot:11193428-Lingulodinium_polyedra.AAC.1
MQETPIVGARGGHGDEVEAPATVAAPARASTRVDKHPHPQMSEELRVGIRNLSLVGVTGLLNV